MKKLILPLLILCPLTVSAEYAKTIMTNGSGNLSVCEDKLMGFMSSCDDEKVSIPRQITENQVIQISFLEKRRGYGANFDVAEIQFNPKKNNCTLRYPYSGGVSTIFIKNCRKLG